MCRSPRIGWTGKGAGRWHSKFDTKWRQLLSSSEILGHKDWTTTPNQLYFSGPRPSSTQDFPFPRTSFFQDLTSWSKTFQSDISKKTVITEQNVKMKEFDQFFWETKYLEKKNKMQSTNPNADTYVEGKKRYLSHFLPDIVMGHSDMTLMDPLVGHPSLTLLHNTLARHCCLTRLFDTLVGHSHLTLFERRSDLTRFLDTLVRHSYLTLLKDALTWHVFLTLL